VLDSLGAADPERVAETPAAAAPCLGRISIRQVIPFRRREAPPAPGSVGALGPEANDSRSLPVQTDEIEGVGRLRNDAAADTQVASDDARRCHRNCRRGKKEDECGRKELHARATRPESRRGATKPQGRTWSPC